MKVKLMFLFSVLVFYKLTVILSYLTQLGTKYSAQSQGMKNSTLKYVLYWNEAYNNKGEEKEKNTGCPKKNWDLCSGVILGP